MENKRRYAIWGSAGHAKVLNDIIVGQGAEIAVVFDNASNATSIVDSIPLYIGESGFAAWLATVRPTEYHGLVAIGGDRGAERVRIQQLFREHGIRIAALIHPTSSVSPTARIGAGSQLLAHSLVAAEAQIGEACILNHKAAIDHECVIGNGVHLAPGVTLCGCVEIGDNVFIGAGSCILPRVKIGSDSIIGAGSLVTRDIPSGAVAYGRPARVIRINA